MDLVEDIGLMAKILHKLVLAFAIHICPKGLFVSRRAISAHRGVYYPCELCMLPNTTESFIEKALDKHSGICFQINNSFSLDT